MRTAGGFALASTLALAAGASGQTTGRVVDAVSSAPVADADVRWIAEGGRARLAELSTDVSGRFAVPRSWTGPGHLEVRALGHRTAVLDLDSAEAAGWRIALAPDPLELEAVLVTAAGRAQRRVDVAVPIERVSAPDIEAAGAPSVEALLAEIPGLQATSAAPVGSNIMIRGIGDSRVLVLVDGQPAGGALLENRDLSRMSLDAVERVEVVKGPLSSLYGSDALGGVINLVTREPAGDFRADARLLSGDAGRKEASATVAGGGALRYRATGSVRQEDRVPGLDRSLDVFARVWDLRSTTRWEGEATSLRFDANVVRERQRWPVGGGFSGFNDNRGVSGWVEARRRAGPGDVVVRAFGQDYTHLYRSARGSAPIAGADEERQVEGVWKGTVGWSGTLGSHDVDVGVEGLQRFIESPDKILENRAEDRQLDVFAQEGWRIGSTTLAAGGRVTMNDRWGSTVSPSLGLSTLLAEAVRLRATVGRGFRAPSFKELAWDFANVGAGYTVRGYADLEPEESWSGSAGVDWAPEARLSLGLEVFTNRIRNLVETSFVGSTPGGLLVYSPRNVARARTEGLEARASWRAGWSELRAEYAYLDARSLADDLPLDRRARHSGRVRVATEAAVLDGLRVDLSAHVTGDAPLIGLDEAGVPSEIGVQERLLAIDAQLSLGVPGGLRLLLGADNLLDTRPEGWQAVVGRRLRVGLEARDLF